MIPSIILISWVLIYVSFKISEFVLLNQISQEATSLARSYSKEMYSLIKAARKIAEANAAAIGLLDTIKKEYVTSLIKKTVEQNNDFYGVAAAFDPDRCELGEFAPYACRVTEDVQLSSLVDNNYNYRKWDWYQQPLLFGAGRWSEPYFDKGGGNALMVTYSAPIARGSTFIGVTTVDITLDEFVMRVKSLRAGESGYSFIITSKGYFVAHPKAELLSSKSVWKMAEESGDKDYIQFAENLKAPAPNFFECIEPFTKKQVWMTTTPVKSTDWILAVIYPSAEVFAPLAELRYNVTLLSMTAVAVFSVIILLISQSVTSPIVRLVSQAQSYSEGNFAVNIDEQTGPEEMRELSKAFNTMGEAIIRQMEDLKVTTSQKERFQQELHIAAEIQQGILQKNFPPFPDLVKDMDLYGLTEPALEVGGDYYDFFRLSDERIGIVVADVAGKGAPSSIFMAMTRTLVLEIAERGYQPAEVLRRVNHMLARNNDSCMFVTLLYGEYFFKTGLLRLVSAGHPAPVFIKPDGSLYQPKIKKSPPLGAFEDTSFEVNDIFVEPGEMAVLYTDGITEAMDPDGREFGPAGLLKSLEEAAGASCLEVSGRVLAHVREFCKGAPVSDDITMLLLSRVSQARAAGEKVLIESRALRISLPADVEVLHTMKQCAEEFCRQLGFREKDVFSIILALDEVATNVIMHAYVPGSSESFQVELIPISNNGLAESNGVQVNIIDHGRPFDFDKISNRYTGEASVDQAIGGMGLFLVRKSVEDLRYEAGTVDGNRISFVKYVSPEPAEA